MKTLSERLKSKRSALGMTQAELAGHVSVRQQTIQLIESGKTTHPRCLFDLARVLHCDPEWLLSGENADHHFSRV